MPRMVRRPQARPQTSRCNGGVRSWSRSSTSGLASHSYWRASSPIARSGCGSGRWIRPTPRSSCKSSRIASRRVIAAAAANARMVVQGPRGLRRLRGLRRAPGRVEPLRSSRWRRARRGPSRPPRTASRCSWSCLTRPRRTPSLRRALRWAIVSLSAPREKRRSTL